jgi:hypothetical protein
MKYCYTPNEQLDHIRFARATNAINFQLATTVQHPQAETSIITWLPTINQNDDSLSARAAASHLLLEQHCMRFHLNSH